MRAADQPRREGVPLTVITASTRLVAIIGDPVEHSLSPVLHNAAFAALDLDMAYVALPVAAGRVGDAVRGLGALGFAGANVTMPHKGAVIAHLDRISAVARRAGAVNTIVVDDGGLSGHNTDVGGFAEALRAVAGDDVAGSAALLVGAGGAARAAALALSDGKVSTLTVANRTEEAARLLTGSLAAEYPETSFDAVALAAVEPQQVRDADIVVNASALGMEGVGKVPAILTDNIRRDHVVFDVVYGKRPTQLLEAAGARGARVVDGREMLVRQAALAFELWTRREAPLAAMRAALG